MDIYDIATRGMAAQRTQMDVIAQNLANAGVVRADGSVYHPKAALMQSPASFEAAFQDAVLHSPFSNSEYGSGDESSEVFPLFSGSVESIVDDFQNANASSGASVAGIVDEDRRPQYRLDPGNPFAQKTGPHKGYVALPDVDPIQQMIGLVASGRAYDADVSMLQAAKQMDLAATDIDRSS